MICSDIDADDAVVALRMAEEAPGPPGFTDVVAIGQSFMTGQDDTALVWLRPDRGQPHRVIALSEGHLVVHLGVGAWSPAHIAHPGWLGQFRVEGVPAATVGEVCVHQPDDLLGPPGHGWLRTPVARGTEAVPPVMRS